MENDKFEKLDAYIKELGISQEELRQWYSDFVVKNYSAPKISTPLSIVYRNGNELDIEDTLNLDRLDEVWGIQLACKVIISVKYIDDLTWHRAKRLANKLTLNGKTGLLPRSASFDNTGQYKNLQLFDETDQSKDLQLFDDTLKILRTNGVKADKYGGFIWLRDSKYNKPFFYLDPYQYSFGESGASEDLGIDRLAIEYK